MHLLHLIPTPPEQMGFSRPPPARWSRYSQTSAAAGRAPPSAGPLGRCWCPGCCRVPSLGLPQVTFTSRWCPRFKWVLHPIAMVMTIYCLVVWNPGVSIKPTPEMPVIHRISSRHQKNWPAMLIGKQSLLQVVVVLPNRVNSWMDVKIHLPTLLNMDDLPIKTRSSPPPPVPRQRCNRCSRFLALKASPALENS